jgi:hypothetical protein
MDKNWLMGMGLTDEQAEQVIEEAANEAEEKAEEARLNALEADRAAAERRAIAYMQEVDLDDPAADALVDARAQALVDVRDSYDRRIDPEGFAEQQAFEYAARHLP